MIEELQQVLRSEIPLTNDICIETKAFSGLALTLFAPLAKNINHKSTAFGGSLYSVSVLSGWGLIYLVLKQHGLTGHIVIQESNTKFLRPVASDIIATSTFSSQEQCDKFIHRYKRKNIARVKLISKILSDDLPAVIFEGSYVVHS